MTQIFEIGVPTGDASVSGSRPNATGQWTSINVIGVQGGGDGDTGGQVVVSRGPDGTLTGGRQGTEGGLSVASQIVASVALPMPNNVQFSYGADWTVDGTGALERNAANVASTIGVTDASAPGTVLGDLKNTLIGMGNSTAFRKTLADAGFAHNPHKEMFYGGPQFRSFPLQWDLSFSSKPEADRFDRMVESLLEHMHPEFADGAEAGVWRIPDSFEISFENAKTRKMKECVLTAVNVDYAASGAGWRAFHDGNPAHVSLALTFMEIKPLTKADIREGA